MARTFYAFVAALLLSVSVGALQPSNAATADSGNYGQSTQTGAYAAGGSAYWPRGGR